MIDRDIENFIVDEIKKGSKICSIRKMVGSSFNYNTTLPSFYRLVKRIKERNIIDLEDNKNYIIKLQAQNQKLQDKNRLANKFVREQVRLANANQELLRELLKKIPKLKNSDPIQIGIDKEFMEKTAIIQLSDLHLNEVVVESDTIGLNVHNYEIASKRLWKYAKKIKKFLKNETDYILVALTGDLLNSDRRPDEVMTNSGNRSEALLYAVQVLSAFLLDLSEYFQIGVVSVLGNESRLDPDIIWANPCHNYDFLIHKILSIMLEEYKGHIDFLEVQRSYETVVNICGANVLMTHGHTKLDWRKAVTKYNQKGVILNYMISGHQHEMEIGDRHSRCSSVVGSNFYSTFSMNVIGRASQNIYTIEKEEGAIFPTITPIPIDLQNTDGCGMYSYDKDMCKAGMRKSLKKASTDKVIIKVVE